jgi:hypothetical protein
MKTLESLKGKIAITFLEWCKINCFLQQVDCQAELYIKLNKQTK